MRLGSQVITSLFYYCCLICDLLVFIYVSCNILLARITVGVFLGFMILSYYL